APAAETALANASRILPLITTAHLPSAANNNYWPEIYTNMSIVDANHPGPYGDTPTPKRFGAVSPLDPEMFLTIDQCADELIKGEFSGKYSPVEVAFWLTQFALSLSQLLTKPWQFPKPNPEFQRLAHDVNIQGYTGDFFSAKLRAAVA